MHDTPALPFPTSVTRTILSTSNIRLFSPCRIAHTGRDLGFCVFLARCLNLGFGGFGSDSNWSSSSNGCWGRHDGATIEAGSQDCSQKVSVKPVSKKLDGSLRRDVP